MEANDPSRSFPVTGGAGFIGSNLVRRLVGAGRRVLNIDKLTYAGKIRLATMQWYLENEAWYRAILDGSYKLERLGGIR